MFSPHQPKELVNRDSDGVAVANLVLNRWLLSYRLSLKLRKTHSCNGLHQRPVRSSCPENRLPAVYPTISVIGELEPGVVTIGTHQITAVTSPVGSALILEPARIQNSATLEFDRSCARLRLLLKRLMSLGNRPYERSRKERIPTV